MIIRQYDHGDWSHVRMDTSDPCYDTGLVLEAEAEYKVYPIRGATRWKDLFLPSDHNGVKYIPEWIIESVAWVYEKIFRAAPRRVPEERLGVLMFKVAGTDIQGVVGSGNTFVVPKNSKFKYTLQLFVNDYHYHNNKGMIDVYVRKVEKRNC